MNIPSLFRATLWLLLAFGRAAWYFRWQAMRSLDLPTGTVMESKEQRRLKHYFNGASYLAAVMCSLRNQPQSRKEENLFANLAALASYFDDLTDSFGGEWKARRRGRANRSDVLLEIESYGLKVDKRGLAQHFLNKLYQALPEKNLGQFRAYMQRVFTVETIRRQGKGVLELAELEKITSEKGGCSVLLFRSVLGHTLSKEEEEACFQFGHLIQLSDDIFDLWHDRQEGNFSTATLLAERGELVFLKKIFEQQVAATQQAFRKTPYPTLQIETALYTLHFLVSITRVCLQHYQYLEQKHGALPLNNRAAMVVDMEIWGNRLHAARYLLRPLS